MGRSAGAAREVEAKRWDRRAPRLPPNALAGTDGLGAAAAVGDGVGGKLWCRVLLQGPHCMFASALVLLRENPPRFVTMRLIIQ